MGLRTVFQGTLQGGVTFLEVTVAGWNAGETMLAEAYFDSATATITSATMTGESAPAAVGTVARGGPGGTSLHGVGLSNVTGTGSKTIRINFSAAVTGYMQVYAFTGRDTAGAFEAAPSASGTGVATGTVTVNPAAADSDLAASFSHGGFGDGAITAGFTEQTVPNFNYEEMGYKLAQAAGSQNVVDTWSGAGAWVGRVVVVKAGAAVPNIGSVSTTTPRRDSLLTLTGTNFGASQGGSTAKIGGVAQTVVSWSATSIVIRVSDLAVKNGTTQGVVVTVDANDSNTFNVTLLPRQGWSYVDLGTLAGSGLLETSPALTAGWQVEYEDPAVVNSDGTWSAPAYLPSFAFRAHDGTSWGLARLQIMLTARLGLFDRLLRLLAWF